MSAREIKYNPLRYWFWLQIMRLPIRCIFLRAFRNMLLNSPPWKKDANGKEINPYKFGEKYYIYEWETYGQKITSKNVTGTFSTIKECLAHRLRDLDHVINFYAVVDSSSWDPVEQNNGGGPLNFHKNSR